MTRTFNLLFLIKRSKANRAGAVPIYLRITINGEATEIAAKRYIDPAKWNPISQKVNGSTEGARSLNAYLKSLEQQVYDAHHEMVRDKEPVTARSLKNRLMGEGERVRTLVPIFEWHNQKVASLLGDGFAPGTLERYRTSLKHTIGFLQWKYKANDIDIRKIDHSFVTEYEFYLRSVRKCNNNTAVKYIKNFGKVVRICIANGWLDKNPFVNYRPKLREVERAFLTEGEIQAIRQHGFSMERVCQVRDIFLFCCYTGLAYIDVKKLRKEHIRVGPDGGKWIFTNRQKTDTASNIPLLPMAEEIIAKYGQNPQCLNGDRLLPVSSNQKMNAYLKEIADLCGIKKNLTFHTARHTFATTVTLGNGVPLESVSKMLGHKNFRTTQHYAKILDRKVGADMEALRERLSVKGNGAEIEQSKQ